MIDDRHEHTERRNLLRGFIRGVVPCPQPGATLLGAARARVRVLVDGRYTSKKSLGIVRRGDVRVLGDELGQLAVTAGIRPF